MAHDSSLYSWPKRARLAVLFWPRMSFSDSESIPPVPHAGS